LKSEPIDSRSKAQKVSLPKKLEHAVRWLIATITDECGPGKEFEIPLRHLVIKGGRGSAKSHSVARMLVNIAIELPVRFLCTREIQKSIDESVYQLLEDVIDELEFTGFFDLKTKSIDGLNGSKFLFAGLRSQDVAKLKSTERIMVCWCEEAHVLSQKSLEVLTPTIREDNSVIIYTYNPELDDDPVHAEFALDPAPDVCVVELNWRDNKWFPKVLEGERQRTYRNDKTPDKHKYNWIWEGKTLPAVEGAIFANEVAEFQSQGRFRIVDHDVMGLTHVVMDLGYGVTTWALWQRFASTLQCIDYYEFYNCKYSEMSKVVKDDHEDVRWGSAFMPHDAAHKDPKTAKSHKRFMRDLGWTVEDVEDIGVENYIERGREMFENAYLDNKEYEITSGSVRYVRGGKRLMQCLKRYRRQVPESTQHPGLPMKDEFAHGGETWCYTSVVAEKMVNDTVRVKDPYSGFRSRGYAG